MELKTAQKVPLSSKGSTVNGNKNSPKNSTVHKTKTVQKGSTVNET